MSSLLRRAIERRKERQRIEGVSAADQEEIRREIERLTERNRLDITPDLLTVRQGRRGALFPLLVNVAALLTVAGGVFAFGAFFDPARAAARDAEIAALEGAEAAVVSELQQQMQAEIAQRDAEIAEIQRRLAEISSEREDIEAEIARQEAERRAELERELSAALAEERARLDGMNLGLDEVERRLAEYEAIRRGEIDREIAAYVERLREERDALVVELAGLESQLQDDLGELAAERDVLEREMRAVAREAEAELEAALGEMAELETRARRRDQVEAQVLGLFQSLRQAVIDGDHQAAREDADNLRALLDDPHVRAVRGEDRREVDLFIVERLAVMLESEPELRSVEPIDELRGRILELSERGEAALQDGDHEAAERHYQEALALVPQLFEGHRFLLEQVVEQELSRREDALTEASFDELADRERELDAATAELEQLRSEAAERIATIEAEFAAREAELLAELEDERAGDERLSTIEAQFAAREAELLAELEQAREAAEAAEARVAAAADDAVGSTELEQLYAAAARLADLEQRYERFRREERPADPSAVPAQLLSARQVLHEALSSTEVESVLPGLAQDVARFQDAHFDAGREDALAEVVDVLYGVGTLPSNEERKEYLERALRAGSLDPEFRVFLDKLAGLLDEAQTAAR